jgi:cellulose synthase/poly-beta-1,6-N-acetylglucosamine synthase-like glycosyltransferase
LAGVHVVITWIAAIWHGLHPKKIFLSKQAHHSNEYPVVSVIVPAWEERGTLEKCIEFLRRIDYPAWEAIIVAGGQDGSYDSAVESCKDLEHFRAIEQEPRGKNAALNLGLSLAHGQIIVLLDADSQVSAGWLKELIAPIDRVVLASTGQPVPSRETPITQVEQMEQISATRIRGVTTLQGNGSIALHRKVLEQIGGFAEEVLVGVDWDLNARLASHNIGRAFCPEAILKTERPSTLWEFWKNEIRWRRAHFLSLFRFPNYFLKDPITAISSLYIYGLSWFAALFTMLAGALSLMQISGLRTIALSLWCLFMAWIILRRAALAMEVAVYSRNINWLKFAWAPPLLLCFTLVAGLTATLTFSQNTAHFKGPRLHRYADHAN